VKFPASDQIERNVYEHARRSEIDSQPDGAPVPHLGTAISDKHGEFFFAPLIQFPDGIVLGSLSPEGGGSKTAKLHGFSSPHQAMMSLAFLESDMHGVHDTSNTISSS
jgi:hypothetical protein